MNRSAAGIPAALRILKGAKKKRGYPDNSARECGLPPSLSVTPPSEREALAKLVRLFIIANGPLFEGAVTK